MDDSDTVLSVTVAETAERDHWRVDVEIVLPSETAADAAAAVLQSLSGLQ